MKYGVTTDYVLGLEVVLADGRAVRLGGPRLKDVAGLSLLKLFVGSEGTLGVITEVTLRLMPAAPPAPTTVATCSPTDGTRPPRSSTSPRVRPSMLEFMDHASINAVEDSSTWAWTAVRRRCAGGALRRAARPAARDRGDGRGLPAPPRDRDLRHDDEEEGEQFMAARRMRHPRGREARRLLLEDVGVPMPRLPELVAGVERIAARARDRRSRSSPTPATATPTR